ncbi:MAG: restriction endonuclease [Proteobacteria bacterium]|nr:restriction endonuclease [Pseudomonadota bacterium]
MNVYDDFFKGISPDDWEYFCEDFLASIGFSILKGPAIGTDGGKDLIVEHQEISYIVSCKHYYKSGKNVGISNEKCILDRIIEHDVKGFIGFYSTYVTESLSHRLQRFTEKKFPIIIFDKGKISNLIPKLHSSVTQKYSDTTRGNNFVLNTHQSQYQPLECLECGKDILSPKRIRNSMAMIVEDRSNEYHFIYGCKNCISQLPECGWVEIFQVLHVEEFLGWNNTVTEIIGGGKVAKNFYEVKNTFDSRIVQRLFPTNMGTWL